MLVNAEGLAVITARGVPGSELFIYERGSGDLIDSGKVNEDGTFIAAQPLEPGTHSLIIQQSGVTEWPGPGQLRVVTVPARGEAVSSGDPVQVASADTGPRPATPADKQPTASPATKRFDEALLESLAEQARQTETRIEVDTNMEVDGKYTARLVVQAITRDGHPPSEMDDFTDATRERTVVTDVVEMTPIATATAIFDGEKLEPETEETQVVTSFEPVFWQWSIRPSSGGTKDLIITLRQEVELADATKYSLAVENYPKTITVAVGWGAYLAQSLYNIGQGAGPIIGSIFGGVVSTVIGGVLLASIAARGSASNSALAAAPAVDHVAQDDIGVPAAPTPDFQQAADVEAQDRKSS